MNEDDKKLVGNLRDRAEIATGRREMLLFCSAAARIESLSAEVADAEAREVSATAVVKREQARAESAEARVRALEEALRTISSDADEPRQLYERLGPQWTGYNGAEYVDQSRHLEKCAELKAAADAALGASNG